MFKAGSFYFPTSTGSFAITGTGFEPQGIIFFGGNQATEDSLLTPSTPAIFFGMTWLDLATGLPDSQALSNIAYGDAFKPDPIVCCGNAGCNIEYRASLVSLDADGFTLNATVAAPGSRLVHYLAWGEQPHSNGTSIAGESNNTLTLGYHPSTILAFHHWVNANARDMCHPSGVYFSMGVANQSPDLSPPPYGRQSNAMVIAMRTFSQLGAIGYNTTWMNPFNGASPAISNSVRPWVAGSILTTFDHAHPTPTLDGTNLFYGATGYPTRDSVAWWDCEGQVRRVNGPTVGDTVTYTAAPHVGDVEAAFFFGNTGYTSEGILDPRPCLTFGVLTPDYQGCVGLDFRPVSDPPSFFQSKQTCYLGHVFGDDVVAASGVISGRDVTLTGERFPAVGSQNGGFMQVWGSCKPIHGWMPQSYRFLQDWHRPRLKG